ncbi:Protein dispatched 1 [Branchiostoma belcheri]|nr:Protein dispatched 1 [Branchiostoma belcheri]
MATWLSIDLTGGFLFRSTSREGHVVENPPSTSALDNAFKRYLEKMGQYEGETLHGCRSGCAISLHMAGESQKGIMEHVGWFGKRTASYYMKVAQVMEPGRPAQKLASPEVTQATERYERSNQVAGLEKAFKK